MSIITGSGDDGSSTLFGGGKVNKSHPRLEAYGTVDEAQSVIGTVRSSPGIPDEIDLLLSRLQRDLFIVGSDLATPDPETSVPRVTSTMIRVLEKDCGELESSLPELKNFILPDGCPGATACFLARAVVRRAERKVAALLENGEDVGTVLVYLNRLGDLLFLVARTLNKSAGIDEDTWDGRSD